ncbi:hypothetical protein HSRCO_0485 [Halanaeroarchaeum sp. HSR-CO]|uniref:hypothetical protein n=1 Tax=Halanaeroarchaeum sp. HSR-CO TaxID=2866382 RepID=UPI00217E6217|nr:hypothetical protein [Halanaeroarchaeum sp. HSR-CO]UWG46781.1 hypothetical protein HSRCO_0485 [Halanaeroarchaeum sp. HSR-CO]
MQTDRPVASVSGEQEWEWNRWQADVRSRGTSTGGSTHRPPRERAPRNRERIAALQQRVDELEADLERKDRRRQSIVDHYERLLAERQAAPADRSSSGSTTGTVASLVSKLLGR